MPAGGTALGVAASGPEPGDKLKGGLKGLLTGGGALLGGRLGSRLGTGGTIGGGAVGGLLALLAARKLLDTEAPPTRQRRRAG